MARKRMISPTIWEDPSFNRLSIGARLLFVGMISNADDDGYVRGDYGSLKRLIFGFDDAVGAQLEGWITELKNFKNVHFFEVEGETYAHFLKWAEYQTLREDRKVVSSYPKCTICQAHDGEVRTSAGQLPAEVKLSKGRVSKVKLSKVAPTGVQNVVNHFFSLKNWDSSSEKKPVYARYVRPAKDLLDLCEGSVEEAKECLRKIAEWAKSRDLDWSIETVFKKWYELDFLKPKEKKPYYDSCRIFQKNPPEGKWYIIRNGEIKELGKWPKKEEITWK